MIKTDLSKVSYLPVGDIPATAFQKHKWRIFFGELPTGKAALLKYNNRQRAHQVRSTVRSSARYFKLAIETRVIAGTLEIHGTDEWLLYVWKKEEA